MTAPAVVGVEPAVPGSTPEPFNSEAPPSPYGLSTFTVPKLMVVPPVKVLLPAWVLPAVCAPMVSVPLSVFSSEVFMVPATPPTVMPSTMLPEKVVLAEPLMYSVALLAVLLLPTMPWVPANDAKLKVLPPRSRVPVSLSSSVVCGVTADELPKPKTPCCTATLPNRLLAVPESVRLPGPNLVKLLAATLPVMFAAVAT